MAKEGMNPKILIYLIGHYEIGVTLNTYKHVIAQGVKEEKEKR
jgi:hypothetical protein